MRIRADRAGSLPVVLAIGVCLTATCLRAAQTTTPASTKKTTPPPSTHATTHSAVHASIRKPPAHTTPPVDGKTTTNASQATTSKKVGTQSAAAASARKTAPPSRGTRRAHARRRPLSGAQRLARLHLEPGRVQEIQQALIREGYLQGQPTGRWDDNTRAAMLHYQTDHGFPATGLPEAKSLMKLGLGPHPLPAQFDTPVARAITPEAVKADSAPEQTAPQAPPEAVPQ